MDKSACAELDSPTESLPPPPFSPQHREDSTREFDRALARLQDGAVAEALDDLVAFLAAARRDLSPGDWAQLVVEARAHPVRTFLHRDPFMLRCYSKPRGPGADATALDYVLRRRELAVRSADPVAALHHYVARGRTARALCHRRDSVAREIDAAAVAKSRGMLRVFMAPSDHLRECDCLTSFAAGRIGKIIAFDMSQENLETVRLDYPDLPIVIHHGSLRELREGKHLFADMDVVCSGGLFERLPAASGHGLARALFALLAPKGTLVIAHFLAGMKEAGFLEAFLDWNMTYRTQAQIFELVKELPEDAVGGWSYSEDAESSLGIAVVRRI